MAKKRLKTISLHHEMQQSYLEYAMSVIVGRALPDARDGLKPVQRRILFAMHELGLTPDRPYRKCARVVGDVLGKYHPHGDQAVYDALVRQVQSFSCRYPILDGHGNFGSVDDDPAAAMRYTETRLASISHEAILKEIDSKTVDFSPNFDGSQQEPNVLPAQLPFLILNGCAGIAVGMATSIPPHNINEVIDGLIELIKNPNLSDEKLLKIIPGPDFPTGGEILLSSGIANTYINGKGSIPMRGIGHIEEITPGKGKHKRNAIIITELPYQLSKAGWIEKLADLVNNGKFNGVADIRDESDRDGMRILIELRRDSNPEEILNNLYQKTSLQSNFGAILLALVNGQPIQLSLKKLLTNFLEFREETIIKRTKYSLNKTIEREEIVEALITALREVKKVISLIEESNDASEARQKLMTELNLNMKQADGVLAMPLRKLTSLEQNSLKNEKEELIEKRKSLELIINNRDELLKNMIRELKSLKKRFGSKRKTKLIEGGDELIAQKHSLQRPSRELQRINALKALNKDSSIVIQIDNQIKIVSPQVIGKMNLTESSKTGEKNNHARLIWPIKDEPKILAITEKGKTGLLKWEFAGQSPGKIEKFLPTNFENEKIINLIPITKNKELTLGLLSSDGRFKRLAINEVIDMSYRSATILKLKENVVLKSAIMCKNNGHLIIASNFGRIIKIKINEEELPIMGKLAQGPTIMKTFPEESVIGAICCEPNTFSEFIFINKKGDIIKTDNSMRESKRGALGTMITRENKPIIQDLYLENNHAIIKTNKGRYASINKMETQKEDFKKNIKSLIELNKDEEIEKVEVSTLYN